MKKKPLILMGLLLNAPLASSAVLSLDPLGSSLNIGDSIFVELNLNLTASDAASAIHADLGFDTGVLTFVDAVAGDFFTNNTEFWVDALNAGGIAAGAAVDTTATSATTGPDQLGFDFINFDFINFDSFNSGTLAVLEFTAAGAGNSAFFLNDTSVLNSSLAEQLTDSNATNVSVSAPSMSVPEPSSLFLLALGGLALRNKWQHQAM